MLKNQEASNNASQPTSLRAEVEGGRYA
jgi:hypothetical protein